MIATSGDLPVLDGGIRCSKWNRGLLTSTSRHKGCGHPAHWFQLDLNYRELEEVMVMIIVTSTEARERFAELLENVEQGPVVITREGGQPAAFLVSASEIDDLADARRRAQAAADFEAWKTEAKKHLTPAAAELTDEEINRLVHELR